MATRNILIVEHDPISALDLMDRVWEAGATPVGPARCLQGALELASRYPIDLALVDVNLSDGASGLPLARLLSDQFGIRTVMVSAESPAPQTLKQIAGTFVRMPVPAAVLGEIMAPLRQSRMDRGERAVA